MKQLHHGVFLKFLSTFRKYAIPFAEPLSSEIATENVKNVVGEDVHTSTSSKTVLNNSTVCLSADLLTRLFLSFLICNR